MAETQRPRVREKKSVLTTTRAMRPNSASAIPPISSGMASIGTTARTPYSALTEVATSLPITTSYPFKSVRNNKPRVPSRFSKLRQSAVDRTPLSRYNTALPVMIPNRTMAISRGDCVLHHQKAPRAQDHHQQRRARAHPVGAAPPGSDPQFPRNDGQKSHGLEQTVRSFTRPRFLRTQLISLLPSGSTATR